MFVYECVHVCNACVSVCIYMYACVCVCLGGCMCVCLSVCVYVEPHVCMCTRVCGLIPMD